MPEHSSKSTRVQLYWNTILRVPVQIVVFVFSILITRTLDPEDFGIMAIVMMLIGYSNQLTNFGMNEAIIQRDIRDDRVIYSIFTFNLAVSVIFTIMFIILAKYIAELFNAPNSEDVIIIMSCMFIITTFYGQPMAILKRDMDFKAASLFDMGRLLFMSILTLILAVSGMEYWSLVYGQLLPYFFLAILICIKAGFLPKIYFNYNLMKGVFHFGGWNFFKSQLDYIGGHIDRFIIGKMLGTVDLGLYDKSVTLSGTPYATITSNINGVMFSSFSKLKTNMERLRTQFRKSMVIVSIINFPIYIGLIVIAPYFVVALLGEKWVPMITTFQIILAAFLYKSITGIMASLLVGTGNYKRLTLLLLFGVVIFIVACIYLVDYGIEAIAIAYLSFNILLQYMWTAATLRVLTISWFNYLRLVSPAALSALAMFVILKIVSDNQLSDHTLMNMVYLILIGAASYILMLLINRNPYLEDIKSSIWVDVIKAIKLVRIH